MRVTGTVITSLVVLLLAGCGGGGSSAPLSAGATVSPAQSPSAAQTSAAPLDLAGLRLCEKVDLAAAAKVMGTKIGLKQEGPGQKLGVGSFIHATTNYACSLRQSDKGKGQFTVLDIFLSKGIETESDFKATLVNVRNNQAQASLKCSSPPVPDLPGATASALFVCVSPYFGTDLTVMALAGGHRFGCDLGRSTPGFDQAAVLDFCQKTYTAIYG